MISKTLKFSLLVVAICSISFVTAQERKEKKKANPEEVFKKLDADANGSLSLEEFKAKRSRKGDTEAADAHFKALDKDANGALSLEEFKTRTKPSKEERLKQRFEKMDANADGSIDFSEYEAFFEKSEKQRKERKPRPRNKKD
ncbi:EF-hand domain-containing protein [Winogradskyella pulchriflava]|uniref:EF-hand domain-containing protein n=1 Tax=Winogradskyella pulchriflava TaxID=1110688 RepID=A0ABV6QDS6_9FLAO